MCTRPYPAGISHSVPSSMTPYDDGTAATLSHLYSYSVHSNTSYAFIHYLGNQHRGPRTLQPPDHFKIKSHRNFLFSELFSFFPPFFLNIKLKHNPSYSLWLQPLYFSGRSWRGNWRTEEFLARIGDVIPLSRALISFSFLHGRGIWLQVSYFRHT